MLNWRTMSEDEFNRIAEALVRRSVMEDNPGVDVKALDGRGGDGGIDLDATVERTGQLVAIYQLKHFPEGFSGEWARARKPQIEKSFESALQHDPPVWYLVVPRNLTPKERAFVRSLKGKRDRPLTRYLGGAELDALLVRFPDIEAWAQRDPLRDALQITGRSTAALSKPGDLGAEVMELARRIQPRSDYWDVNFSRVGDVYTQELVAKRADAPEREPLSLTFTADFSEHPHLGTQFKRSMEYGLTEPLLLPHEVVTDVEQHGVEWFAGSLGPSTLELRPKPRVFDGPSSISLLGADGRMLARRDGLHAKYASGTRGGLLVIDVGDSVTFTLELRRDERAQGQVEVSSDISGLSGASAKRALRFLGELQRAEKIQFAVEGRSETVVLEGSRPTVNQFQLELAEDLAYIEDALNITFLYPDTINELVDRIWVRVVRLFLEGKPTLMPGVSGWSHVLSGERDEGLEGLLQSGGAVRQSADEWEIELFGQSVVLTDVTMLMPSVTIPGAAEHLAALRAGHGEDRKVLLEPTDGVSGVLIWSPSRTGDLADHTPTPWALDGVREHRQLRQAGE